MMSEVTEMATVKEEKIDIQHHVIIILIIIIKNEKKSRKKNLRMK